MITFSKGLKNCDDALYLLQHPHLVLPCAEKKLSIPLSQLHFLGEEKTEYYTKFKYSFSSIAWPKFSQPEISDTVKPSLWKHEIDIFIPKENPNVNTAALYITGGYINSKTTINIPDKIISQLIQHNIVIVLKNDPNQYLTINNKPRTYALTKLR